LLWAITSYFNPCRYKARPASYRLFRAHLNVPLVTVEAGLDGRFELGPEDSPSTSSTHSLQARPNPWTPSKRTRNCGSGTTSGWCGRLAEPRSKEHRLYDACILGTGDRAILCAALGEFQHAVRAVHMNFQIEHCRLWAAPFFETMRGRVGSVEGRVFRLWHGDLKHNEYKERNYFASRREDGLAPAGR
jgi:hypothetical protein